MGTPLFVNQTVAGAVATGTHGSSLKYGSFSNQVLAVKVILANGTTVEISEESHPFLMKAFRVNVGRLGVVTDVKLKISPETLAQRILRAAIPSQEFMHRFKNAQEMYKHTGTLPDWLDGTNIWWMVRNSSVRFFIQGDHFQNFRLFPVSSVHIRQLGWNEEKNKGRVFFRRVPRARRRLASLPGTSQTDKDQLASELVSFRSSFRHPGRSPLAIPRAYCGEPDFD